MKGLIIFILLAGLLLSASGMYLSHYAEHYDVKRMYAVLVLVFFFGMVIIDCWYPDKIKYPTNRPKRYYRFDKPKRRINEKDEGK